MPAAAPQPVQSPIASWRVAIIDDVYAGPTIEVVKKALPAFCAAVSADDEIVKDLAKRTTCDFVDPAKVTAEAIVALYKDRAALTAISAHVDQLFFDFDQRLGEVTTIERHLKANGCKEENIKAFPSVDKLFAGAPFQLVFLDLLLTKGEEESRKIAKDIYEKFKAFILLMSNSPAANPQQVEGFRRKTRLLRGFFEFRAKEELRDEQRFRVQIESLPRDPAVCHAVHTFVMALEDALGGSIEEPELNAEGEEEPPPGDAPILPQFMHTLRALGLHDYALLCELTLRNEGHPLGDYLMRLLGSHLLSRLLAQTTVNGAIAALDKLRFTEFLPFGDSSSPSFHRMYADATTEAITGPWEPHPWSIAAPAAMPEARAAEIPAEEAEVAPELQSMNAEPAAVEVPAAASELLYFFDIQDDARELPYVQLGDLLIKDEQAYVYAVLSASCELQFVPANVHGDRERLRDDTVLIVPGRFRAVGAPEPKRSLAIAGLVEWNGIPYGIDWFYGKLFGLPHCALRKLLQERGYVHHRRLQIARALELQQAVLSKVSRIGLEVRPPFPRDIRISLFARQPDQSFVQLGDALPQGGLLFHGRKQERVLVLRQKAFYDFGSRMKQHAETAAVKADAKLKTASPQAADAFMIAMVGMKLPIEIPAGADAKAVQLVDSAGKKHAVRQVAIRFGTFEEPPTASNKELMFCLSAEEE